MKLFKNIHVFAPEDLGVKDVLIGETRIVNIADHIEPFGDTLEVIDKSGCVMTPGLIDTHVHVLGGGGEQGPASRTPELGFTALVNGGITTVIGLLGTDGFSRDLDALIAKTKALKTEGVSAYALSGSYQLPLKTLTGSIERDMMLIEEVIGAGEVAISDHRSSAPTTTTLSQLLSGVHVGGLLSNKGGVMVVHVGGAESKLEPLKTMLEQSDAPAQKVLPTHINRSKALFLEGVAYSKTYQAPIDLTASTATDVALSVETLIPEALRLGVDEHLITVSSDGQGSLPKFNAQGTLTDMGIGSVQSLLESLTAIIKAGNLSVTSALKPFTLNPAKVFNLQQKGQIKKGYDADLCVFDDTWQLSDVYMRATPCMVNKRVVKKGFFDHA